MSEEEKKKGPEFEKLTDDEIKEFIMEKVKNHSCPACSSNHWMLLGDTDHYLAMMALRRNGTFSLPPPSIPVASMACTVCGYVRNHAMGTILEWKAKK